MSKKRISAEYSNGEQRNEGSNGLAEFQQIASVKRGKFDSLSDKTLHDLPMEMLECILVKAVAMEVKGMKLAKSVWKAKADLVISRLRTVCSQWSSILTTNFFRNELHRALDGTVQETIRLEILHQSLFDCYVMEATTMKDEILLFCLHHFPDRSCIFNIMVYDRNNMSEVKDVIALPGIRLADVAACNVSNCLYVLEQNRDSICSSIFRITRDEEHKFNIIHTLISDLSFGISFMSASAKGNLIIISDSLTVSIFSPTGFLNHEVRFSPDVYGFSYVESAFQKSNGNLVLASLSEQFQTVVTEINTDGIIERQYKSSLSGVCGVNFADISGRILINDPQNGIELLDSELNLLDFTGPQPNQNGYNSPDSLHYNSERNEVVGVYGSAANPRTSFLTIFRFSEQ